MNFIIIYQIKSGAKFEKLKESEKEGIIQLLKQVEIYVENQQVLEYMTEEQIQDIKIQYWAIKELYKGPYKVFLKNLTREQFLFKYLQAKKYIKQDTEFKEDIVKYFIKILQTDLIGDEKK